VANRISLLWSVAQEERVRAREGRLMEEGGGSLCGENGAQLLRGGAQDAVRQRELDLRVLSRTRTTTIRNISGTELEVYKRYYILPKN